MPMTTITGMIQGKGAPAKPVLPCFLGTHGLTESLQSLPDGTLPSYAFPETSELAVTMSVADNDVSARANRQPAQTISSRPVFSGRARACHLHAARRLHRSLLAER